MDVRRLVHIVEKLTSLVTEREYAIEVANAQDVLEESLRDLDRRVQVALEGERETSELLYLHEELTGRSVAVALHSQAGPLPIKCDRQQLRKALTYLLRYLIGKGDEGGKLICSMSTDHEGTEPILDLLLVGRTDKVSEEEIRYLFDPFAMVQDTPLDVGPCVSQRIIEEQGGTLKARRERDGVVFHARFPLARERATHEVR
jgi:C4-dicarboxylate-specific signal transduction histidine kinase